MLLSFVDNSSKFLFVSPNLILVPSLAAFELSYTNFNSRVVISRMEFKRYTFSVIDYIAASVPEKIQARNTYRIFDKYPTLQHRFKTSAR